MASDPDGIRVSADQMDEKRQEKIAYEYLCHLEETKTWIEMCIREPLPQSIDLEEALRNGVFLAKLAHRFQPQSVPLKKIYDIDQIRYREAGLTFRHTDNINHWLSAMSSLGLPAIFLPETTDLYDRKNMPRVIYSIHALSLYLYRLGKAPPMPSLYGKAQFSDEAVKLMSLELKRYGFPLPQFGKIGGILAGELPIDAAEHHAAIIAINKATEEGHCDLMIQAMGHPAAQLRDIDPSLADLYLQSLIDALDEKKQSSREQSLNSDFTADVYDELLTGSEIQYQMDSVNEFSALEKIAMSVESRDVVRMMTALAHPNLGIKRLNPDYCSAYLEALHSAICGDKGVELCDVQALINQVNHEKESLMERQRYVNAINISLEGSDPNRTLQILRQLLDTEPMSELVVLEFAAALYHEEMNNFRSITEEDLSFEMICGAIRTLTQVAQVTQAVDGRNVTELLFVLEEPMLSFDCINTSLTESYMAALTEIRRDKIRRGEFCTVLTHNEIQCCIIRVNEDVDRKDIVQVIQRAVDKGDAIQLAVLLGSTGLVDQDPVEEQAPLYLRLLKTLVEAKRRSHNSDASLSMGDIEEMLRRSRELATEAEEVCLVVTGLNNLRDPAGFVETFSSPYINLPNLSRSQFQSCTKQLGSRIRGIRMEQLPQTKAWVMHRLEQGIPVYLNVKTQQISWEKPRDYTESGLIGLREFEDLVVSVVQDDDIEALIIRLQACARGYLVRERIAFRLHHFHNNVSAVIKIQTWWRTVVQRQRYLQWQQRQREERQRQPQRRDLKFFAQFLDDIVLIQACWRRWLALRAYRAIKRGDMPLCTLRRFLHLLDIGQRDYDEEMQVQLLKSDVVQTIRRNKQLEKDLNTMDIKIGLLVKNQIALQEVVAHGHKLRKHVNKAAEQQERNLDSHHFTRPGIELLSLTKTGRHKLEAYQHLFYLLQTEPRYLSKLLFLQPQKMPETMILSLYNYGSNLREEYLLLKLFRCALEEEVRHKVDNLSDISTGNPLVIKLILQLSRQGHRVGQLRELLGPIVERILKENIFINLSPVEIYKLWINQLESASGEPCGMPYEIGAEDALKQPEVQRRLKTNIEFLKAATSLFLEQITYSIRNIPYGMLYVAKVLARALRNKFPLVPEKDVLKVIGNLVYYRYINPTIVSPDAFDIISVSPTQVLTTDQRRNLGNIAKMLQFAASKKGFAEESPHLMCLNPFIIECHEKFKAFFKGCIQVEEPEVEFGMDQYSEATLITKPTVCMSLQEVANIHQCLVEYEDVLAPQPEDPLHQILDDFGSGDQRNHPSIQYLLAGESKENVGTFQDLNEVAKTEIFLTLTNKFEMSISPQEEKNQKLFVATKQMLVSILRCCHGDSLKEIIIRPASIEEQAVYTQFCRQQMQSEQNSSRFVSRVVSNTDTTETVLNSLKMRVSRNLRKLEQVGLVASSDNYAVLVAALARDVVTLRTHRRARSQELDRLLSTKSLLDEKTKFHEEQVNSYQEYLETCLKNLTLGKNQKRILQHRAEGNHLQLANALKSRTMLHYSATKLHQKGILIDIEGLPHAHFKSTFFDISPAIESGVFDVTAKFMGVSVEKVQLNIQDLLQMQFEGVTVLNIFKKAKINVNLLIFLLNSKFYGKTLKKK